MLFHLATSDGFGLVKNHHGDQFQAPEAEAVVQTLALTPRGKSRKPPMPNGCKETRNGRERGARDRSQRPRGSDENPRFISGGKMIEFTPWTTFRHAGFNARPAEKVFDQSGDAGSNLLERKIRAGGTRPPRADPPHGTRWGRSRPTLLRFPSIRRSDRRGWDLASSCRTPLRLREDVNRKDSRSLDEGGSVRYSRRRYIMKTIIQRWG